MGNSSQRAAHPLGSLQSASATSVPSPNFKRRRFLLALGAGGAGAAAVASQSLAAPVVALEDTVDAAEAKGYRETDHIRDYYATTRI
jgi:hypothetical protein